MAEVEHFADALREVKEKIVFCSICNNLTDVNPCLYCSNPKRDRSIICVVEEPYNLVAVEKTRSFRGLYHILHGTLSPIRGIGPDELMIRQSLAEASAGEQRRNRSQGNYRRDKPDDRRRGHSKLSRPPA